MAHLITIPFSHYCEKARWAADRAGVDYTERRYPPLLHGPPAILAAGQTQVPIYVDDSGTYPDSTDILRRLDAARPPERKLFPAELPLAAELEERFDAVLGPKTRVLGYHRLLPNRALCAEVAAARVTKLQAAVAVRALGLAEFIIRRMYTVTDAHAAEAEVQIEEELRFAEGLLADGRPFLAGERFTAADLSFAAFLGVLMALDTYGHPFPAIERRPAPEQAAIEALRARPAGQHVIRLYETERR